MSATTVRTHANPQWRGVIEEYRDRMPVTDATPIISLREGGTPLVRANVLSAANHLRHGSPAMERMVANGQVIVVGAEYDLESGIVDFFDGVPKL